MLTLEELKIIEKTPTDISLEVIAKFYEKYISNRIYELEMEDGTILVFLAENKHFPHLIGLHKFQDKNHQNVLLRSKKELKNIKGFNNLKNTKITLQDLKSVNGNIKKYNRYKKRILNFPFSYQLLRESIFVSYDKAVVEKTTRINGNYIFVNDIGNDKLHFFFIDCADSLSEENDIDPNQDDAIVPITFIVTKKSDFNFVANQDVLKIKKIIIKNLCNSEILEEYNYSEVNNKVVQCSEVKILELENNSY